MLKTISGDKHPQRTGARSRFPARRLHLVDIENLAGHPRPSLGQIRQALSPVHRMPRPRPRSTRSRSPAAT